MVNQSTARMSSILNLNMFAANLAVVGICPRAPSAAGPNDPGDPTTLGERPLVVQEEKAKPKQPPLYAVILLNDDYTPREFVTRNPEGAFWAGRRCRRDDHDARAPVWRSAGGCVGKGCGGNEDAQCGRRGQ